MHFLRFSLILLLLGAGLVGFSQTSQNEKQPRILIVLDGSSSMLQSWTPGQDRFKAASKIITTLIDSVYKVNKDVEFALRVYGHQYPSQENNCYDTQLEVMFSKDNLTQMELRLNALHPYGVTPIAFSIKEAAEKDMLDTKRNTYSLILITDGGESCGGNLCEVVRALLEKKIDFKPYILSLVDYAPLKEQYNCLGNYLLVTGEKDIKPTVGTIVEAYRPLITMKPAIDKKILQTIAANPPSVLRVDIPSFKVQTEDNTPVVPPPAKEKPKPIAEKPPVVPPVVKDATPAKDITNRTTEPRIQQVINKLTYSATYRTLPVKYVTQSFTRMNTNAYIPPIPKDDGPPTPPPTPPVVKPTPKPVVAATPKIQPTKTQELPVKLKEAKFDIIREDAPETSLEIYFWDGKGKFYRTSPQIVLTDPATKKQVHKFFRTVDQNGNPDPKKELTPGTYDLTITKSKIFVPKIEIKPNQKNVYRIVAGKASLRFEYEDDPNQPVKEYVAQVKKNFEAGAIVDQYCTQELEYEPGNYHIIINTLPKNHKSVDLDFETVTIIRIEKPGYLQLTNKQQTGKINLYYELGDQFISFAHPLVVTGNPEEQKLELQRGRYRLGYKKNGVEVFKEFLIRSKQITDLFLD
jgi:hypothetical protein